jgi:hypothetical protein
MVSFLLPLLKKRGDFYWLLLLGIFQIVSFSFFLAKRGGDFFLRSSQVESDEIPRSKTARLWRAC